MVGLARANNLSLPSKKFFVAKCVIVGANGFLGSYLVDELVLRGHDVTAFDRFSAEKAHYSAGGVTAVVGDFMNQADIARALAGQDYVFHFLSTTTPASAEDDPSLDVRTNIASSIDLLRTCVEAKVSRVYFASTGGAIYGDQPNTVVDENTLPQPISPYAIGKLAIERYLGYFERKYGLASVALRISNPYGPRQRENTVQGVIPIFLRRIKSGLPLTIFGDGTMVRDYIYVSDAVGMIADTVGRDTAYGLYNVGSGVGTAVRELVEVLRSVTGSNPKLDHTAVPPTFVDHVVLDTRRFAAEFGSRDLVDLHEGVARTWKAISEELE